MFYYDDVEVVNFLGSKIFKYKFGKMIVIFLIVLYEKIYEMM